MASGVVGVGASTRPVGGRPWNGVAGRQLGVLGETGGRVTLAGLTASELRCGPGPSSRPCNPMSAGAASCHCAMRLGAEMYDNLVFHSVILMAWRRLTLTWRILDVPAFYLLLCCSKA